MYVIILLICLSASVNCDGDDEGKYIDLLPESEKKEFLERVARRILEEVETKQFAKEPSVSLSDSKLGETSSYVSKLLKEEAADIKRRSLDLEQNKTSDNVNSSLRGGDVDKAKYIDLTLRDGPHPPELGDGNHPEHKETTTSLISTRTGIESTLDTTEEVATMLPEKKIVDIIKSNDLPLIGSDNVTEISNVVTNSQVVTTSSPIEEQTKRSFRNDEKIDIQITIDDVSDTKSPKMKPRDEPLHFVYEDNLKVKSINLNKTNESKNSSTGILTPNSAIQNENSIQDDKKSPKMRTSEDKPNAVHKYSIPIDTNKTNKSITSDTVFSTPNSVTQNVNSIQDSINQAPQLSQDNGNQTILKQQKPLRNDRDIRESARVDDEFHGNSRKSAVNEENEKEVNVLPEDDAEAITENNMHLNIINDNSKVLVTTTDTPAISVTSTQAPEIITTSSHAPQVITTSTDFFKAAVIYSNVLDGTVTSTEAVKLDTSVGNLTLTDKNYTANETTDFHFRASDIMWPQTANDSSVVVVDITVPVNKIEVTTTTEESMTESTTQKNFRRNDDGADTTIPAPNMRPTKPNIAQAIKLNTTSNVDPKGDARMQEDTHNLDDNALPAIERNYTKSTPQVFPILRDNIISETPARESELPYYPLQATTNSTTNHQLLTVATPELDTQTASTKAWVRENEYSVVRAQEDNTESKSLAPLKGPTDHVNFENVLKSSNNSEETTTQVILISEMSTKTASTNTSLSTDTIHIKRRIGEYGAMNSEKTDGIDSINSVTASIKEPVSETSKRVNDLVSHPVSVTADDSADEPASKSPNVPLSKRVSESVSKPATESAAEAFSEVQSDIESARASELISEFVTELATKTLSVSASESNNGVISESPSDSASTRASASAGKPKSKMTSKLASKLINEPATEPANETSSKSAIEASSESPTDLAGERNSESGSESVSESIPIKLTPQSILETNSEVEQSLKNKNNVDKLKGGTTLPPPTPTNEQNNTQIEKPDDVSKNNLKIIHATTDSVVEDTTVPEIIVTTIVIPLTTTDKGDLEVKTKKFDVESTTHQFDSSDIMTKVPRVSEFYVPNILQSNKNKSENMQDAKLSLKLGLVPEAPVTEKKFESLVKFHSTQVMKEYSVYEVRK